MINIEFLYKGNNVIIQSNKDEKILNSIEKFTQKLQVDKSLVTYLYNGSLLNEELKIANLINNEENNMKIIVTEINPSNENIDKISSNNIICPKCGENILMNINKYNINLFNCKNGHNLNVLFKDFEETQKIDLSKIKCDKCNKNKSEVFNNELYICLICKNNLCPLCKSLHDKGHEIINYNNKDYICNIHFDSYI